MKNNQWTIYTSLYKHQPFILKIKGVRWRRQIFRLCDHFFFLGLRMNGNNIFRSDLAFKCNTNAILWACVVVYDVIKKKREVDFNYRQSGSERSKQGRVYKKLETIRSGWGHRSPSPIYNWFFFPQNVFI